MFFFNKNTIIYKKKIQTAIIRATQYYNLLIIKPKTIEIYETGSWSCSCPWYFFLRLGLKEGAGIKTSWY